MGTSSRPSWASPSCPGPPLTTRRHRRAFRRAGWSCGATEARGACKNSWEAQHERKARRALQRHFSGVAAASCEPRFQEAAEQTLRPAHPSCDGLHVWTCFSEDTRKGCAGARHVTRPCDRNPPFTCEPRKPQRHVGVGCRRCLRGCQANTVDDPQVIWVGGRGEKRAEEAQRVPPIGVTRLLCQMGIQQPDRSPDHCRPQVRHITYPWPWRAAWEAPHCRPQQVLPPATAAASALAGAGGPASPPTGRAREAANAELSASEPDTLTPPTRAHTRPTGPEAATGACKYAARQGVAAAAAVAGSAGRRRLQDWQTQGRTLAGWRVLLLSQQAAQGMQTALPVKTVWGMR